MFRTITVSALLGLSVGAGSAWYVQGLRWDRSEATRTAQEATRAAQATLVARQTEQAHQAAVKALGERFTIQKEQLDAKSLELERALRSNRMRLTAPGVCTSSPVAASPGGADAPGSCELQAGTSADLAALAGRADSVALKLNALQDYVRGLSCGEPDGTLSE